MTVDHQALLKQFEHLNHMNPHTFEVDDLDRLIKSVSVSYKMRITMYIWIQRKCDLSIKVNAIMKLLLIAYSISE